MDWTRIIEVIAGIAVGGILAKLPALLRMRTHTPSEVRKLDAESDLLDAESTAQVAELMATLTQTYKSMVDSLQNQLDVSKKGNHILQEELARTQTELQQCQEERQTLAGHNRVLIADIAIERQASPLDEGV